MYMAEVCSKTTGQLKRMYLSQHGYFLCRLPNWIAVQSVHSCDRISVGTGVDNLCARGGIGRRDAILPSLIYIEWGQLKSQEH